MKTTLTLLGTAGGPGGHPERAGIATLIESGSVRCLVDAGDGVSGQLARAGIAVNELDVVLLTHLHDDHTAGLPGLLSFRHTMRGAPLRLIGPPGTRALLEGILAFLTANTAIRGHEGRLADPATLFDVEEAEPGLVFVDGPLTVTAAENSHYGLTTFATEQRSYAFRFDAPDRSIVLTGDTGESVAVETLARGADVLVSEMVTAADVAMVPPPVRAHMLAEHLSPVQVGRLAARAGVAAIVLSHFTDASPEDLAAIRGEFTGNVIAGTDLLRL